MRKFFYLRELSYICIINKGINLKHTIMTATTTNNGFKLKAHYGTAKYYQTIKWCINNVKGVITYKGAINYLAQGLNINNN